jgi:hypothetical protein
MNDDEARRQIRTQIIRKTSLAVMMVTIVTGIPVLFNSGFMKGCNGAAKDTKNEQLVADTVATLKAK